MKHPNAQRVPTWGLAAVHTALATMHAHSRTNRTQQEPPTWDQAVAWYSAPLQYAPAADRGASSGVSATGPG